MPTLNVLSWNSTGETETGAAQLREIIDYLTDHDWFPQVIVLQEARAASGGMIHQMLADLGDSYNPPAHAQEGGQSYGRGYLLCTHTSVGGHHTFGQVNLELDEGLRRWREDTLNCDAQLIAAQELAMMRMPAAAMLTVEGRTVPLLTWHLPRGPGQLLTGLTLPGGANPDAFLFLQNSAIYHALSGQGQVDLAVVAGDMNVTVAGINAATGDLALPWILPGWTGVSDHLDHLLGHPQAGQRAPVFAEAGNFDAPGTHNVLVGTVQW